MRDTVFGNSASAALTSSTWIVRRSHTARPPTEPRLTGTVSPIALDQRSDPRRATRRRCSPSRRQIPESVAPQTRAAFSTTAFMTGCRSVGELAITRRISAVAVCCSSASFVSLNRRTFSIAITAWSAKVSSSPICLVEKSRSSSRLIVLVSEGLHLYPPHVDDADGYALTKERRGQGRSSGGTRASQASQRLGELRLRQHQQILDVNRSAITHRAPSYSPTARSDSLADSLRPPWKWSMFRDEPKRLAFQA